MFPFSVSILIYSKTLSRFKTFVKIQTFQCTVGIMMNIATHIYAENMKFNYDINHDKS